MNKIPVNDSIIYALSRLINDAQTDRREPSHSDLSFQIQRAGLVEFDPNKPGSTPVGKEKRIRNMLISATEVKPEAVESFSFNLISLIKSSGGFRQESPNFVGKDEINTLASLLKDQGILLHSDGSINATALDSLRGTELTAALENYISRAKKGIEDAALVIGTSKDLIEAVCAHIIQEIYGSYNHQSNFPVLLAQAYSALNLSVGSETPTNGEHPRKRIERNLFELACSINTLRNKQGTGHGRPFLPDLTNNEAKVAVESIAVIAEFLLNKLKETRGIETP